MDPISRIGIIGILICMLLLLFLADYQTNLTCHRSQNLCQLSHQRIIGSKIEKFPVNSLIGAEAKGDGDEEAVYVVLETSQGDKIMVSTFFFEAEAAANEVNTFLYNPYNSRQELLQVNRSDLIRAIGFIIMAIMGLFTMSLLSY